MLTLIWAQDEAGLIGAKGTLPWHVSADLKFFKEQTMGQTILMGRTTFIGMGERLLPKRTTWLLTKDTHYQVAGAKVFHSVEEVLQASLGQDLIVTGGAKVYENFLPYADRLVQTVLAKKFSGDTYFPKVNWDDFQLVTQVPFTDAKSGISGYFNTYHRK